MTHLLREVVVNNDDAEDQWKTMIFCPNCGLQLTFDERAMSRLRITEYMKIVQYRTDGDDQVVLLNRKNLHLCYAKDAYTKFQNEQNH